MRITRLALGLLAAVAWLGCSSGERGAPAEPAPREGSEPTLVLAPVALEEALEHPVELERVREKAPATAALDLGAAASRREELFRTVDAPGPAAGGDPRSPLPAPAIVLTAIGVARFAALPARPGRIPVLLYHAICPVVCDAAATYGVSQVEFARMLLVIRAAGFTTISIADYVRSMKGDTAGLPPRPILLTFDDGRLDAYRGADDVLRAYGAKATMYAITSQLGGGSSFYMSGVEMDAALASGRWDVQVHAHAGHSLIIAGADADGGAPLMMPFYAARRYAGATPALESFAAWRSRAANDLDVARGALAARGGGIDYASLTFAVPYGNYGQNQTNDPAIAPELRAMLDARFAVWFTQPPNVDFSGPARTAGALTTHEAGRYTIRRATTAETLYDWLASHSR